MTGCKDTLKTLFNHERYQSISACVIIVFLVWIYGCESTVRSIQNPLDKVTRTELQTEINYFLDTAKGRMTELDRKDELKRILTEQAMLASETGTVNPMGVVATLIGAFGIGATVDNVRKRKEIKDIKTNSNI